MVETVHQTMMMAIHSSFEKHDDQVDAYPTPIKNGHFETVNIVISCSIEGDYRGGSHILELKNTRKTQAINEKMCKRLPKITRATMANEPNDGIMSNAAIVGCFGHRVSLLVIYLMCLFL